MTLTQIFGYIAAFCTTFAFIPQVIKTVKTKDVSGISLSMYSIFTTGVLFWFLYGVAIEETPIIIANSITLVLAGTVLIVAIKEKHKAKD